MKKKIIIGILCLICIAGIAIFGIYKVTNNSIKNKNDVVDKKENSNNLNTDEDSNSNEPSEESNSNETTDKKEESSNSTEKPTVGKLGSCYQEPDLQMKLGYSIDYIEVETYLNKGLTPDGYEIYRKAGNESYKKIATVKSNKFYIKYKDTNVSPGKSYTYKMRAYKIINNQTIYGEYSDTYTRGTFYKYAKYKVEAITPATDATSEFIIKITNDKYSKPIKFNNEIEGTGLYIYNDNNDASPDGDEYDNYEYKVVKLTQFSYDNKTWTNKKGNKIMIDTNAVMYLKFTSYDGKTFPFNLSNNPYSRIEEYQVDYGYTSYLKIDLRSATSTTYWHSEDIF